MSIVAAVESKIRALRLLDHPFYTTWSKGELSREALARYAEQYYHWTKAFPTFVSAVHAQSDDLELRRHLLENLNEEEAGPDNHPELWLRFCDALGLDRETVKAAAPLPETTAAVDAYKRLCANPDPLSGLTALYAYESQQPEVMKTKRDGLVRFYGITEGHDFFAAHETADVIHSQVEAAQMERIGAGRAPVAALAADAALRAQYTLLDGVYDRYVACGAA